ncbi:L-histidine N(alpha)-methyltransferase [bacterium]|nr:L-histidine N(alpha)-methyltransferase [bacterium]
MNQTAPTSYLEHFAREVAHSLSLPGQKELPSKYFYDELGSALFEAITMLPEYGLTRASERLLQAHAEEMVAELHSPLVVELGCGTGKRTRSLLEALASRLPVTYCPIEISGAALARCELEIGQVRGVTVVGYEQPYLDGLRSVLHPQRPAQSRALVLFLGSSVGNFDRPAADEFLRQIRSLMRPGDALLLETDLLKPAEQLLAAYDDPIGLTAAFNLNILARLNRELGGDFNLSQFEHQARFNPQHQRIEMHLRSRIGQRVRIPAANLEIDFAAGETIWTENSHKYRLEDLDSMAARTGFSPQARWVDEQWPFAQNLWLVD